MCTYVCTLCFPRDQNGSAEYVCPDLSVGSWFRARQSHAKWAPGVTEAESGVTLGRGRLMSVTFSDADFVSFLAVTSHVKVPGVGNDRQKNGHNLDLKKVKFPWQAESNLASLPLWLVKGPAVRSERKETFGSFFLTGKKSFHLWSQHCRYSSPKRFFLFSITLHKWCLGSQHLVIKQ